MTDTVRFEVSGPVATITLNRPDRLNAMTEELIAGVLVLLEQVSADEAIRVLVLTGAGRGFCAGGDLGAMGEFAEPRTPGASIAQLRRLHRTTELLHEMPKPTIAAVNGPCAGAGLSWACACDLRIAAESAVFRTAFLSAGLTGDFGGTWLLTRLVGAGRARDLYFRNEKLSAAAAAAWGWSARSCRTRTWRPGWLILPAASRRRRRTSSPGLSRTSTTPRNWACTRC